MFVKSIDHVSSSISNVKFVKCTLIINHRFFKSNVIARYFLINPIKHKILLYYHIGSAFGFYALTFGLRGILSQGGVWSQGAFGHKGAFCHKGHLVTGHFVEGAFGHRPFGKRPFYY